jgi:uncharacterized repeat protein (TIGR03803 family)
MPELAHGLSSAIVAMSVAVVALTTQEAQGQAAPDAGSYGVVTALKLTKGASPYGALVQAADGNFYGTTLYDATYGTAFRMTPAGKIKVVHHFTGPDGNGPSTSLTVGPDGNLYGLTAVGGANDLGTAFEITLNGKFKLLHSFGGASNDGTYPYLGALVVGPDGDFYGTTMQGGVTRYGTAFKMSPKGKVTVLHQFAGGSADGGYPRGGLTLASDGNFYGTTVQGGANDPSGNAGTLFRLSSSGDFSIVVNSGGPSNLYPNASQAAPTQASDGLLYGTTSGGGQYNLGTI